MEYYKGLINLKTRLVFITALYFINDFIMSYSNNDSMGLSCTAPSPSSTLLPNNDSAHYEPRLVIKYRKINYIRNSQGDELEVS